MLTESQNMPIRVKNQMIFLSATYCKFNLLFDVSVVGN